MFEHHGPRDVGRGRTISQPVGEREALVVDAGVDALSDPMRVAHAAEVDPIKLRQKSFSEGRTVKIEGLTRASKSPGFASSRK